MELLVSFDGWVYSALVARFAVDEKIIGLTLILDFFDRCTQNASLDPPQAALGVLAQSQRSAKLSYARMKTTTSLYRIRR